MQGGSEFVKERKAQYGDIVRTNPFQVIATPGQAVDFIPITFNNQWMIEEVVGKNKEFRGIEPLTASNQDLPWEFQKGGTTWRRTKLLNLYALLPADIAAEKAELEKAAKGEMPDPDKALLPVMFSFRSTGYAAGKSVVTHFAKAAKFKLPGYVSILRLSAYEDKNDSGSYYVPKVEVVPGAPGKVSLEDQATAAYWAKTLKTQKVEVDTDPEVPSMKGVVSGTDQF
jgi:hypothetical protein